MRFSCFLSSEFASVILTYNILIFRFVISHCLQCYGEPVSMETEEGQSNRDRLYQRRLASTVDKRISKNAFAQFVND